MSAKPAGKTANTSDKQSKDPIAEHHKGDGHVPGAAQTPRPKASSHEHNLARDPAFGDEAQALADAPDQLPAQPVVVAQANAATGNATDAQPAAAESTDEAQSDASGAG